MNCPHCGEHLSEPPKARHSDSPTAKSAAALSFPHRDGQRRRVLRAVAAHLSGLTAEEVAGMTGLKYVSASTRVSELKRGGWLEVAGARKTSSGVEAEVLMATPAAQRALVGQRIVGQAA